MNEHDSIIKKLEERIVSLEYKLNQEIKKTLLVLGEAGKSLGRRENIQYVYTDAHCPLCRVTPLGLIKQGKENQYDKEKYRDMLLATPETVLGYFGFDGLLLEIRLKRETGSGGTHLMRRGIETSRMRKCKTHHAVLITTMIGVIR